MYLPLCKVADTPFHIQGDEVEWSINNLSTVAAFWLWLNREELYASPPDLGPPDSGAADDEGESWRHFEFKYYDQIFQAFLIM